MSVNEGYYIRYSAVRGGLSIRCSLCLSFSGSLTVHHCDSLATRPGTKGCLAHRCLPLVAFATASMVCSHHGPR